MSRLSPMLNRLRVHGAIAALALAAQACALNPFDRDRDRDLSQAGTPKAAPTERVSQGDLAPPPGAAEAMRQAPPRQDAPVAGYIDPETGAFVELRARRATNRAEQPAHADPESAANASSAAPNGVSD